MKYIGTILISGLLFSATTLPAQPKEQVMTLDEMYALADANSKTIKIFETALAGAEQDVSVARNAYLPNVDVSASASYNGNVWVADRDFSNGQNFTAPHFGNEFSVEASQVVFAGGAIHNNIKVLEIQKQISEWNLAEQRQQVYFLLAGYYLDLYKYRNLLVVYDRNMEQTMEVIGNMRAREAAGVALDNDITRYEVQYQNLSYKRTELISSIAIYNDKFERLQEQLKQTVLSKLKKDKNSLKKMQYKLEKEINSDNYRLYGDLIMANLYNFSNYSKFIDVYDYENDKNIKIELDETKTLKENANNFYKLYNKGKNAIAKITELTSQLYAQIQYYEQILYSLDIAESITDLKSVQSEIEPDNPKGRKEHTKASFEPMELEIEGFKVFVGKNNRQNDYIVSKLSKDEDFWFHTKDCAGSHVLLKCENPSDDLLLKCANLAKQYSKGANSSKIGVIYTKRKYLKKPPASNLGYVIYKNEREIIL